MKVLGKIKPWRYPEASERELSRSMQEFSRDLVVYARDKLDGMRFDATDDEINDAESDMMDYAMTLIASLVSSLPALALTIYKFNSKQWIAVALSAGGKEDPSVQMLQLLGYNANETWYAEKQQYWISMAQAAYLKLARDITSDWSTNVRLLAAKGKSRKVVDETINIRYGVYSSWSKNRASGIVATWNSLLMRQRLADAKVTHYIWHGMLDERERLSHLRLEGKEIPVNSDHIFPGEEYGCRCWATPKFPNKKDKDK